MRKAKWKYDPSAPAGARIVRRERFTTTAKTSAVEPTKAKIAPPKMKIQRHSHFYECELQAPDGAKVTVKKVKTGRGAHFVVVKDGVRIDSYLSKGKALARARDEYKNLPGSLL